MSEARERGRRFARRLDDLLDDAITGRSTRLRLFAAGHQELRTRLAELEARTRFSLVNMQSRWRTDPAQRQRPLDQNSLDRGVRVTLFVPRSVLGLSPLLPSMHPDLWIAPVVQDAMLVDDVLAILPGDLDSDGALSLWLTMDAELVADVRSIRDALLAEGRRAQDITGAAPLNARQLEIALALARGDKDTSTARRLNVSLRTVEREVSVVLGHLGVSSRHDATLAILGEHPVH